MRLSDFFTEAEAAKVFNLKPRTLRRYTTNEKMKKYDIRTVRISGKEMLYNKRDIDIIIHMKAI